MGSDQLAPDTLVADRYRIVRKLGQGGMSVVYEAQHVKLARSFALKALLPTLAHNPEAVQRFEREAELLAGLRHPNIVDISDWVTLPDGSPAMVLEFLHGAALQVRLSRAALPWDAIARIGDQIMSALALAHRNGITHRDLKPENIFISIDDVGEERVKLLDFGVSKLRGVGRLSGEYAILGTPAYMSPEQASGQTDIVGPSTDVWAMGAILYEMATQQVAFRADNFAETLSLILEGIPDPIALCRPDAPPAFIELVDRALSRDPELRITTIEDLRARLRAALEPVTMIAGPPPMMEAPRPGPARLTPVPGSRLTPVPGSRLTPVPGSRLTPAPGSRLTPAPGSRLTPAPGSGLTPTPGLRLTPAPGSRLTPGSGEVAPASPLSAATPIAAPPRRWLVAGAIAAVVITLANVAIALAI